MIGSTFKPGVTINPPAPAAPGVNALVDPGLTSIDSNTGFPACYQPGGWGTNTVAWANSTNVPPGSPAGSQSENVTITGYSSGDAKLVPTLDQGACTPTVVPGNTYNLSVQYESTADTQFALYYRTTFGNWVYWTSGPWLAASPTWATATFTTPAVPAGANGVSFGLALIANGQVTTDDYSFVLPAAEVPELREPRLLWPRSRQAQPWVATWPRRRSPRYPRRNSVCTRTSSCTSPVGAGRVRPVLPDAGVAGATRQVADLTIRRPIASLVTPQSVAGDAAGGSQTIRGRSRRWSRAKRDQRR